MFNFITELKHELKEWGKLLANWLAFSLLVALIAWLPYHLVFGISYLKVWASVFAAGVIFSALIRIHIYIMGEEG